MLQYKLLNGSDVRDSQSTNDGASAENTFKELLLLCRGDLDGITKKLNAICQYEQNEDKLRKEIIDQGRKMNELRNEHERQIFEQSNETNAKLEQVQDKFEQEKKRIQQKYKEELTLKNEKIKDLERQQQRDKAIREKAESINRQIEEIKEINKNLTADRDIVHQDKELLQEKCSRLNEELSSLKDKFHAKFKP